MADLPGYISDTELYYETDESTRNLLTGRNHAVTGADNLIVGEAGTIDGTRNALFSLDGAAHTITDQNTFAVYADTIILNGTTVSGSGGTIDISALLDTLGY